MNCPKCAVIMESSGEWPFGDQKNNFNTYQVYRWDCSECKVIVLQELQYDKAEIA